MKKFLILFCLLSISKNLIAADCQNYPGNNGEDRCSCYFGPIPVSGKPEAGEQMCFYNTACVVSGKPPVLSPPQNNCAPLCWSFFRRPSPLNCLLEVCNVKPDCPKSKPSYDCKALVACDTCRSIPSDGGLNGGCMDERNCAAHFLNCIAAGEPNCFADFLICKQGKPIPTDASSGANSIDTGGIR